MAKETFRNTDITEFKRKENPKKKNHTILYYEIYDAPKKPTDCGKYYAKTPLLAQAETVIERAKENKRLMFLKAVCSDGKRRIIL